MKRPLAGLRLGVILLFLLGFLSPMASIGAGSQDLTCDDFNSARAAQRALDNDPDLEDSLDPDGNGEACDHDETATDDEDPATEEDDEPAAGGDEEAYLGDIQSELDDLSTSFDRFLEIDDELGVAEEDEIQDLVTELNDIAALWVEYPEVAAEFEAPAGLEDVEDAYLDLADTVGEAGEGWEEYWAIPAEDDDEEEIALAAFNESFTSAQDQVVEVQDLVDELGGGGTSTGDDTDEPTEEADDPDNGGDADADEYLATVQDELDTLTDDAERAQEILDSDSADDADEINEIFASWAEYSDIAADLVAPAGLEDVEDAYLDLADTVTETGENWDAWWTSEADSPEEEEALAAFEDSFASVQDQILDTQDLVDELGGGTSTGDDTDEPTEEVDDPTPDAGDDADGEAYVADVQDQIDEWNDSIEEFNTLLGGDRTDEDIDAIVDISLTWLDAPNVAAEFEAPAGYEDVQAAFEDYADVMEELSMNFTLFLSSEPDTAEGDDALDAFFASMESADAAYAAVQDEIDAVS